MEHLDIADSGSRPASEDRPLVLVVDDEPSILAAIQRTLKSLPLRLQVAESATEAIAYLHDHQVAVIVSDHMMPGMNGLELLALVRQNWPRCVAIMVTACGDMALAADLVNRHLVHGLLPKPWTTDTLRHAVTEAMEVWKEAAGSPQAFAEEHAEALREQAMRAVLTLARAVDARDRYTLMHSERVASLARLLGEQLKLPPSALEALHTGGLLHDVGKIGVGDAVLLKPTRLTPEEFAVIRTHPRLGASIVEPLKLPAEVAAIIHQHHENHNGSGYPDGLAGDQIHMLARVVHVVDAYEAMSANRVYRVAREPTWIHEELLRCRGTQFDPMTLDAFLGVLEVGQVAAVLGEVEATARLAHA